MGVQVNHICSQQGEARCEIFLSIFPPETKDPGGHLES